MQCPWGVYNCSSWGPHGVVVCPSGLYCCQNPSCTAGLGGGWRLFGAFWGLELESVRCLAIVIFVPTALRKNEVRCHLFLGDNSREIKRSQGDQVSLSKGEEQTPGSLPSPVCGPKGRVRFFFFFFPKSVLKVFVQGDRKFQMANMAVEAGQKWNPVPSYLSHHTLSWM